MTKTFSFQQIAVPKVLSEEVREAISNNVLQFYVRDQQQEAQDEGLASRHADRVEAGIPGQTGHKRAHAGELQ